MPSAFSIFSWNDWQGQREDNRSFLSKIAQLTSENTRIGASRTGRTVTRSVGAGGGASHNHSPRRSRTRQLAMLAALLFLVTVGGVIYFQVTFRQRPVPKPAVTTSIAVLAFLNIIGDPESDHLSDGLTDEITSALTQLRGCAS